LKVLWNFNETGKAMRQTVALLFIIMLLAACTGPQSFPETQTAPAKSQNCAYVWATQPLPDLSAKVQSAIHAAGLTDIQASAEAYGENCFDPQTNTVRSFASMETDFHFTVQAVDLTNLEDLGGTLEKILIVLDAFPPGKVPGPQTGNIVISFQSGKTESNLSFNALAGKSARTLGLHGAALFEKLQKK
jgi:hypothetical protein